MLQSVSLLSMPSRHTLVGSRSEPPLSLAPSLAIARPLLPPPARYPDEEVPVHDDVDNGLKVEVASTVDHKPVKDEPIQLAYVAAIKLEDDVKPFRADPFHLQRVGGRPFSPSPSPSPPPVRRSISDHVKTRQRTPVNYRLNRPYSRR